MTLPFSHNLAMKAYYLSHYLYNSIIIYVIDTFILMAIAIRTMTLISFFISIFLSSI